MNRFDILLKKTPPPAPPKVLAESTVYAEIRKTILAGKFPFKVEDASVHISPIDPDTIIVDVLVKPIYPVKQITINLTIRQEDVFHGPALGSALARQIFNLPIAPRFFETSWVANPPDPAARLREILPSPSSSNLHGLLDMGQV
jgi:hypothetical protein